jgi:heat shock protein HslJ
MRRSIVATMALLAFGAQASAQNAAQPMGKLAGRWMLTQIGGKAIRATSRPIEFQISGTQISGFDGCNSFSGDLEEPSRIVATQMACVPGTPSMPIDAGTLVSALRQGRLEGGVLLLKGSGGETLRFRRQGG